MSFAKTLKKLRKKAKITRYALARESGVNSTYRARLESGEKVHPGRQLVLRIGQALLDNSGNCVPCSSHFGFGLGGLNLTQPEFPRQGVNYLGFLTQQLGPSVELRPFSTSSSRMPTLKTNLENWPPRGLSHKVGERSKSSQ